MIPIFSNSLGDEELVAIRKVFESKWVGSGEEVIKFEKEFAHKIGSNNILLFNSATSALFSAMEILGIGKGDEVLIPTINFIGCSNAIIKTGAKPIFCDVDEKYFHILPSEIKKKRTDKTKAILLLHYGGHPLDFREVKKVGKGLIIIEDSANSIISRYYGENCGTLGDIGIFSFDAMKFLVMGNGGAMVIQDEKLLSIAKENRYFGLPSKKGSGIDSMKRGMKRWWEIELNQISGRHISNDILATIGRVQLRKLDWIIERRKAIWEMYKENLGDLSWLELPPEPHNNTTSSYYLFWLKIKDGLRDKFAKYMILKSIYVTFRYFPLHLIKYYDVKTKLPIAEKINEEVINIPIHQNLSDKDIYYIIETIRHFKI